MTYPWPSSVTMVFHATVWCLHGHKAAVLQQGLASVLFTDPGITQIFAVTSVVSSIQGVTAGYSCLCW